MDEGRETATDAARRSLDGATRGKIQCHPCRVAGRGRRRTLSFPFILPPFSSSLICLVPSLIIDCRRRRPVCIVVPYHYATTTIESTLLYWATTVGHGFVMAA